MTRDLCPRGCGRSAYKCFKSSTPCPAVADAQGPRGPDSLRLLYDDPAVVNAMEVLKKHSITGAQFQEWVKAQL